MNLSMTAPSHQQRRQQPTTTKQLPNQNPKKSILFSRYPDWHSVTSTYPPPLQDFIPKSTSSSVFLYVLYLTPSKQSESSYVGILFLSGGWEFLSNAQTAGRRTTSCMFSERSEQMDHGHGLVLRTPRGILRTFGPLSPHLPCGGNLAEQAWRGMAGIWKWGM
jgi:hypothetical protein